MLVIRFFFRLPNGYRGKKQGKEREEEERKREVVLQKFV